MRRPRIEEKETLTVEEAISLFGLSRRKFWKLMNGMDTILFLAMYGSRRLIIRSELELWLQNHPHEKEALKNGTYRKTAQEA